MNLNKTDKIYDLPTIQLEIDFVVKRHGWWEDSQISLQSLDGKNWHAATGSEDKLEGKETDFSVLNTSSHWELTKFITENNLYRTRIMKLKPKKCYSYHYDWTPRIHLAVTTHPYCFMIVDKEMFHIPADSHAYLVDTAKAHTALNSSVDCERVHIVGCVKKENI